MAEKTLIPPKNVLNPGHFGKGVIGEDEYEKEQAWKEKTSHGAFGDAVVGEPQPQKPTAAQLRAQPELGPLHRVKLTAHGTVVPIDTPEPVAPVVAHATDTQQPSATAAILAAEREDEQVFTGGVKTPTRSQVRQHRQIPLDEIKTTLERADYLFDSVFRAEFKRVEGPRKKALRMLLDHAQKEAQKADAAVWAPVIEKLEEALKPKEA